MVYSGIYRCSGCSATFADPTSWREAVSTTSVASNAEKRPGTGIGPGDNAGPVPGLFASWGSSPASPVDAQGYGRTEADTEEIREAARRANKSKGRKWGP